MFLLIELRRPAWQVRGSKCTNLGVKENTAVVVVSSRLVCADMTRKRGRQREGVCVLFKTLDLVFIHM